MDGKIMEGLTVSGGCCGVQSSGINVEVSNNSPRNSRPIKFQTIMPLHLIPSLFTKGPCRAIIGC